MELIESRCVGYELVIHVDEEVVPKFVERDARGALRGGRADRRGGRGGTRGGGGYGRGDPRGGGGGRGDPRGGGGAAMAVGRASARPGTGRGRGVGRGRGRGTGSQDLEYDCSLSTQAQGTSHAFEAKRQQLRDLNGGAAPVQELACSCGTPAASRTVRKEGPNKGRDFFCCSKPQGEQCGFFKFADEVVAGGSQTGGGARAAFGGGGGFEAGGYAEGAVDPPVCQCGQVKVMRTVRKEGPTQGKQFFVCPKDRDQQCPNNFQWSDDVAPTLQGGAGGVGFGGGGGGGYGGGYGGGGGGKGSGSALVVKGSTCNCHKCECEQGHINVSGYNGGSKGYGKNYVYGSMEGEYCNCDYCKCKNGYGLAGKGGGGYGH